MSHGNRRGATSDDRRTSGATAEQPQEKGGEDVHVLGVECVDKLPQENDGAEQMRGCVLVHSGGHSGNGEALEVARKKMLVVDN